MKLRHCSISDFPYKIFRKRTITFEKKTKKLNHTKIKISNHKKIEKCIKTVRTTDRMPLVPVRPASTPAQSQAQSRLRRRRACTLRRLFRPRKQDAAQHQDAPEPVSANGASLSVGGRVDVSPVSVSIILWVLIAICV